MEPDPRGGDAASRLSRAEAELAAARQDLETLSYSVSHDLRAPLRAVEGFSRIALEDAGDSMPAEVRSSLERVRRGAADLSRMIDGLLELSRAGRAPLAPAPVDLAALAAEIAAELRRVHAGREVELAAPRTLAAQGDPALLRLLLSKLLDNAWKFTAGRPRARVELGAVPGSPVQYFVRDDGAGFDGARADRLFAPFARLHAASEFPGLGMGLAVARCVVRRHGGSIRAQGRRGGGATVSFTLGPAR